MYHVHPQPLHKLMWYLYLATLQRTYIVPKCLNLLSQIVTIYSTLVRCISVELGLFYLYLSEIVLSNRMLTVFSSSTQAVTTDGQDVCFYSGILFDVS